MYNEFIEIYTPLALMPYLVVLMCIIVVFFLVGRAPAHIRSVIFLFLSSILISSTSMSFYQCHFTLDALKICRAEMPLFRHLPEIQVLFKEFQAFFRCSCIIFSSCFYILGAYILNQYLPQCSKKVRNSYQTQVVSLLRN